MPSILCVYMCIYINTFVHSIQRVRQYYMPSILCVNIYTYVHIFIYKECDTLHAVSVIVSPTGQFIVCVCVYL